MQIFFGGDHAGFELKAKLISLVEGLGFTPHDLGSFELNSEDDYPDFVRSVAEKVASHPDSRGVIIGGSGQGEAMVANRIRGVRAAVYYGASKTKQTDMSGHSLDILRSTRIHNDANVLALGARFLTEGEAKEALRMWLETDFSGDPRHVRRIAKIDGENA